MCRSFENNWNTYKLLAHINPPDVKVRTIHFPLSKILATFNKDYTLPEINLNKSFSHSPEQHQCGHHEHRCSLCWYECCRPCRSQDGHHSGSQHVGCPWRLWRSGSRTGMPQILLGPLQKIADEENPGHKTLGYETIVALTADWAYHLDFSQWLDWKRRLNVGHQEVIILFPVVQLLF